MSTKNHCPVTGCFCWKNPLHLVGFFALLPFAVKGFVWVWAAATAAVNNLVK